MGLTFCSPLGCLWFRLYRLKRGINHVKMLAQIARRATSSAGGLTKVNGALSQLNRSYHEKVVEHYNNPRNVGSFDKNDPNVGTGLVGAPACGDVMKLQIKVDDDGNIVDSCFKTFGCGSAIASSSVGMPTLPGT